MRRLLATVSRKVVSWLTGKFLAEVLVSAVATVSVTALFSGSSWTSPGARTQTPPALVPSVGPVAAAVDAARISFDAKSLSAAPETFVSPAAAAHPHRIAAVIRAQQSPARVAIRIPPARPAPDRPVAVATLSDSAPKLADAVGSTEGPKPAIPPPKTFTVFGISPTDLVPSPSTILGSVASVSHSIADLAASL
jgi:hypothetical protein